MPYFEKNLGNGLMLRSLRDEKDVARFIALNEAITGEGAIVERLLHHHPEANYDDYFLVIDALSGEAVSSTCLIPWRCNFEGIPLKTAMLEMVVTHPDYRRRGLVRSQINHFHHMVAAGGYDVSIIQGIPYYYRQYDYTYALEHTPVAALPAWRVPDGPEANAYSLRPATLADSDSLAHLYQSALADHQLYVQRTSDYWRYLLQRTPCLVHLVNDIRTNRTVGYVRVSAQEQHLRIHENGITEFEAGWAILRQLKTETSGEIQVVGSQANTLVRLARSLDSQSPPCDQWLLRLPNVASFLRKIGALLENRLAQAGYAGLTSDLCLNFFRQAVVLCFEQGKLQTVKSAGFIDASMGADGGDLCIPPDAFIRLVFGFRSLDALQDAWPDIRLKPASRSILEALFPRMTAHILMPY